MNALIWILFIIAFIAIEAATVTLVSVWFAGGALAALIAERFGADFKIQILVFLLVTAVCVVLLRKSAVKSLKGKKSKTNLDRIIGQNVVLKQGIDAESGWGTVLINDVEWKVKSEDGNAVSSGERVKVVGVEGVKLIVKR